MPSMTRRQQRYLEHKFGHAWVKKHHFDKLASEEERRKAKKRKEEK